MTRILRWWWMLGFLAGAARADDARLADELARLSGPDRLIGFDARGAKAQRGLAHILTGRALGGPFPFWIYRQLTPARDAAERWKHEGVVPSPFTRVEGFATGLGEAIADDEKGLRLISKTCLECHAGTAAGYTIAGMGNSHIDVVPLVQQARDILAWDPASWIETRTRTGDAVAAFISTLVPAQLRAMYRYVRDYKDYIRDFLIPPYKYAEARGDNLGPYGVWLMAAYIADPEKSGIIPGTSSDERTRHERDLVDSIHYTPVDPQPWWSARFKSHAYWFWDSPGHAARDFHFNFYFPQRHVDDAATLDAHRAKFLEHMSVIDDVLAFVREIPVPPLPVEARAELDSREGSVARGEEIFHGGENSTGRPMACAGCHGTYRRGAEGLVVKYPDRGTIDAGTDRAYNDLMRRLTPVVERAAATRAVYGDKAPSYRPITKPGYAPPVLVGLWASAPYLHNGSVPTLAELLRRPDQRLTVWGRRVEAPSAHDWEGAGLAHDAIDDASYEAKRRAAAGQPLDSSEALEYRRFYDTRRPGKSNQGHSFGTDLSEDEKRALIDFLLSLAPATPDELVSDGR